MGNPEKVPGGPADESKGQAVPIPSEHTIKVLRSVLAAQEGELAEVRERVRELEGHLQKVALHYKAQAAIQCEDVEMGWRIGQDIYDRIKLEAEADDVTLKEMLPEDGPEH